MKSSFDQLVYFADPMCSWCYGFGPAMNRFADAHRELKLSLVMGGLRPYTKEPMMAAQKKQIVGHWQHVADASGLKFNDALLMTDGFVYDTEPACRAVATARAMQFADVLAFLKAIQIAFYRDARDVTSAEILADIAAEIGFDRTSFLSMLESTGMREAVKRDFALSQSLGIRGFPTLCAGRGSELAAITNGYASVETIEQRFGQLMAEAM